VVLLAASSKLVQKSPERALADTRAGVDNSRMTELGNSSSDGCRRADCRVVKLETECHTAVHMRVANFIIRATTTTHLCYQWPAHYPVLRALVLFWFGAVLPARSGNALVIPTCDTVSNSFSSLFL